MAASKFLTRTSVAGAVACIAALGGVFAQVMLSGTASSATSAHDAAPDQDAGVKFPPFAVPIYSQVKRIGYCVLRVEYFGGRGSDDEWQLAVARVTNDLYIEFTSELEANADGPAICAGHVGKSTDNFKIYKAEFYEQIDPNKLK